MRRVIAGVLIVIGALLMLAAAEKVSGAVLIVLGLVVEVAGHALERRRGRQ